MTDNNATLSGITFDQMQFIKLVKRSPANDDGWVAVSKTLTPLAIRAAQDGPNFIETKSEGESFFVRLTPDAKILEKYA